MGPIVAPVPTPIIAPAAPMLAPDPRFFVPSSPAQPLKVPVHSLDGNRKTPLAVLPDSDVPVIGATPQYLPGFSLGTPDDLGFYGSADILYAAARGVHVPPMVTLSPAGTNLSTAGSLYQPNTLVQFGDQQLGQAFRPGFRLNFGYIFGPDHAHGIDFGFFFLGSQSESYNGSTAPGGVILARPAVNGVTQSNFALPLGAAGPAAIASSFGSNVIGGDVNYRWDLTESGRVDMILGYRYLHLGDDLNVYTSQGVASPVPTTIAQSADSFRTRNDFHGPQFGYVAHRQLGGRFSLDVLTKLAMGVTVADADIRGATTTAFGTTQNGFLTGPTNAGSHTTTSFAVVPEFGAKLGYDVTETLRFTFGYTFLYWSRVERAPNQVDLTVGSANRPAFPNKGTDFWVQGLTTGLALKY